MSCTKPSGYFGLCRAEPFRIFFPLATLLGISGVSLWPLFFSGLHESFYPGVMHARLMIESFLGGFVIGFLGTAAPRLLSAPTLRSWEVWTLVLLHLLTAGLHIGHQIAAGDACFALQLIFFIACIARRITRKCDLPPPSFVLVGFGLACALSGSILWALGARGLVDGHALILGGLLLNQCFLLALILGVGGFLLPRFLKIPNLGKMSDERRASAEWTRRALKAAATAALLLASYIIETFATTPMHMKFAGIVRAGAALWFLATEIRFHRTPVPARTVPLCVNLALLCILIGVVFPLAWPAQRIAGLHVVFLGGFSLITFTVATRVVLGHSGNLALFDTRLPSLLTAAALILVATILRTVGDFLPTARPHWLSGSAYLWMLAAAVWSWAILPKVRIPDPDPDEHGHGPGHRARAGLPPNPEAIAAAPSWD